MLAFLFQFSDLAKEQRPEIPKLPPIVAPLTIAKITGYEHERIRGLKLQ